MLVTYKGIKKAEEILFNSGRSYWEMVLDAGKSIALYMRENLDIKGKNILFLCGRGNNAADAIVAATNISNICNASICMVNGELKTKEAQKALNFMPLSVAIHENINKDMFETADIIVDGIFGIGFRGEMSEELKQLANMYNSSIAYKIALDIPSGVECDTGKYVSFFKPNMTIIMSAKKPAHFVNWAKHTCGDMYVIKNDITDVICENKLYTDAVNKNNVTMPTYLPWSNKSNNGRLALICGSNEYIGAALLACSSALRSGVGYVYLFSVEKVCNIINQKYPEVICIPMETNEYGTIDKKNIKTILEKTANCNAIAVGCGMGDNNDTERIVQTLINRISVPLIIDADGINSIKNNAEVLQIERECPIIITPHIGEFKRIATNYLDETQNNIESAACEFTTTTGVTLVLKDFITKVYSDNYNIWSFMGNSALAKAGSGDVLTGIIASFTAQGLAPIEAVKAALYLQGKTVCYLSKQNDRLSILPSDLPKYFGIVLKK